MNFILIPVAAVVVAVVGGRIITKAKNKLEQNKQNKQKAAVEQSGEQENS